MGLDLVREFDRADQALGKLNPGELNLPYNLLGGLDWTPIAARKRPG